MPTRLHTLSQAQPISQARISRFQSTTGYITTSNTYVITPTSATDLWDSAVNAGPLNQITLTTSTGSAVLTLQSPFVTVTENSNSLTTNGTSITGIGFPGRGDYARRST